MRRNGPRKRGPYDSRSVVINAGGMPRIRIIITPNRMASEHIER